jgi:hypothetical protein
MVTIHPITGEQLIYVTLPMGLANSPAIAHRIGSSCLHQVCEQSATFHGKAKTNTWHAALAGELADLSHGYGCVEIGANGLYTMRNLGLKNVC